MFIMWMGGNASYKRCPRNLTDFEATWPHVEVWWLGEWCWSLGKSTKKTPFESIWYSLWAIFINFPVELPWETTGFPYLCWFTGTILFCWKAILSSFARFFHLPHWCKTFFLDHFSNGPWPLYDPQKWTFSIDLGKNNWWTDGRNSSFFTGCWQIKHLATRLVNLV